MTQLTEKYSKALLLAEKLHHYQMRKGEEIPYISHLLRVSGLVFEFGGDEDTAIAALLHDAVEDQGGLTIAYMIEEQFGEKVRGIVLECSDSLDAKGEQKRAWKERKTKYIEHLKTATPEALLVSACDKLDNLSSTLRIWRKEGIQCFRRFTGGDAPSGPQQVYANKYWYYRSIIDILHQRNSPVADELEILLNQIFAEVPKD